MSEGVTIELKELIDLKRFVKLAASKPKSRARQNGQYLSTVRGRGMDFAEVRNYQPGDEIRHMEWRVTARTGRPHVKLYQEEKERPVVIVTDFNASMFFGTRVAFKSVLAARLAALIAWTVVGQGDRVGGLLFSEDGHQEFVPRNRDTGVLSFLASLSQCTQKESYKTAEFSYSPLSSALLRLRRVARPGSTIVLISDFYHLDKDTDRHLSRLSSHNDILAYHVCDPLELFAPKPAQYAITNGRQEVLLDTTINKVTQHYQNYCETRLNNIQNQFKTLRIPYVQVTAETDLPLLIRQTFPGRRGG